ncbi:transposase [Streptomyces sp. NPDC020951]|uniref:transposase n=1 Tax=Streptomyces sp. NPDC020951 TaxID=3365104 RepID=UPI0037AB52E4
MRRTIAGLPLPKAADVRLILAVDISPWLRPNAATCLDRSFRHTYGRGEAKHQLTPGSATSSSAAEVLLGLTPAAEGRVDPPGLEGDQRPGHGQAGLRCGDAQQSERVTEQVSLPGTVATVTFTQRPAKSGDRRILDHSHVVQEQQGPRLT